MRKCGKVPDLSLVGVFLHMLRMKSYIMFFMVCSLLFLQMNTNYEIDDYEEYSMYFFCNINGDAFSDFNGN